MLDLKVDLAQFEKEVQRLAETPTIIEGQLTLLAQQAGQDVVDYAQYLFRLPKHGQPRMKKDGSGQMIGSAPGEAPAIDTGTLDSGFLVQTRGFMTTVDPKQEYAARLEEDLNRPFMQPSMEWAGERFVTGIVRMIERAL